METLIALKIWTMIYQQPVKDEFKIINTVVETQPVIIGGASESATFKETPIPLDVQQPPTVETYTQLRPEPTGCYLGDSIPLEACEEK